MPSPSLFDQSPEMELMTKIIFQKIDFIKQNPLLEKLFSEKRMRGTRELFSGNLNLENNSMIWADLKISAK